MSKIFSITDLTREFGVTTRTIRFYEQEGMLHPRRDGRRRLFQQRDRTRLRLILRGRRLGFALAEIREIIDLYDREPGEGGQLRHFIGKIAGRRADLEQKRRDIDVTLLELADAEQRCRLRLDNLEGTP